MKVESGNGLGVGGVNPFESTQETARPDDAPKVAKDNNPFRNGVFGALTNRAKSEASDGSSALRFGARLPGLGSNNPFAKAAEVGMSMLGKASPVGMAVTTLGNAALNHLGPTSTLGQMGSIAQHAVSQGTNQFLNNAEDAVNLSQLQDAANQNMKLTNAASRIQQETSFNQTIADMNNKTWDKIEQMFNK